MPIENFAGNVPKISQTAFIHKMATIIGKVQIGSHSSVWPNVSIRGDLLNIEIGKYSNIQDNTVIHTTELMGSSGSGYDVVIGNLVTIGHSCVIHGCKINDNVLVGIGTIILDNVIIEKHVMIGAGSVIPPKKTLESGYLYFGNPVKKIRVLNLDEKIYIENNARKYSETILKYR